MTRPSVETKRVAAVKNSSVIEANEFSGNQSELELSLGTVQKLRVRAVRAIVILNLVRRYAERPLEGRSPINGDNTAFGLENNVGSTIPHVNGVLTGWVNLLKGRWDLNTINKLIIYIFFCFEFALKMIKSYEWSMSTLILYQFFTWIQFVKFW